MTSLLSEHLVDNLNAFHLNIKKIVEGFMVGLHTSPYHGYSVEFADYRQYIPGDQIKDIDWKLYAKTDRYYVRRYEDETNVNAYILIDHSNSMGYSSHNVRKLDYAKTLASSLTYLISKQNDAVGLVTYNDDITYWQPPKTNQAFIAGIYKKLYTLEADSLTNSIKILNSIAEKINKRSLIIIISDFLDDVQQVIKGIKHFRYLNHDVIIFHILDNQESDFNFTNETIFVDSEYDKEIRVFPREIRENYQNRYNDFCNLLNNECLKSKVEYISFSTNTPLEDNLLRYLIGRSKL